MTGTIVALAARTRTGTIRAEDGSLLIFHSIGVLGDYDTLTVGNSVSFGVERGRAYHTAVNVLRHVIRTAPSDKPQPLPDLRYAGFEQAANIRSYCFDALSAGRSVPHRVTVDIELLAKHHIGMQEAPVLCMRKLLADLQDSPHSAEHVLGDEDLLACAASRAAALQRKRPRPSFVVRRGQPPPSPTPGRRAR